MEPIILSKNEALKKQVLSRHAKMFELISFATSEPVMGSDVAGSRCLASPTETTIDFVSCGSDETRTRDLPACQRDAPL